MSFNKKLLAVLIASTFVVSAAHAVMSDPTPKVVGHKPVLTFTGTKPASVTLGDSVTLSDSDFNFTDADGDAEATRNYQWFLDGTPTTNTTLQYDIGMDSPAQVNKRLTLASTPSTTTGDPKVGDKLVIDFGIIGFSDAAGPLVQNLTMTGTLVLGQKLSATYAFNMNGGEPTDKSTFKWGHVGTTTGSVDAGDTVTVSGVVDEYTLTTADVGEIVELSVRAKNGLGLKGNVQTKTSVDLAGGGSGGEVVNPLEVEVKVTHAASGTEVLNGPDFAGRPVVAKDTITANCKAAGAPDADLTTCDTTLYNLQWKANSGTAGSPWVNISGQTGNTYLPASSEQGKQIAVEVTVK